MVYAMNCGLALASCPFFIVKELRRAQVDLSVGDADAVLNRMRNARGPKCQERSRGLKPQFQQVS